MPPTHLWIVVNARQRKEPVDGDVVQLRSAWVNSEGRNGYLLGEADSHDSAQRVFAFGLKAQKGSFWRVARNKT